MSTPRLPYIFLLSICAILFTCCRVSAEVHTFFPDTQYSLNVYYIHGEQPGPTIFVQGGIQGDESSGFLTAQILTKARVLKGNLILVPRVNTPSINLRTRAVNVDLNRRFDQEADIYYEDSIAKLVRYLVNQSQGLIHLHEGSGFYDPEKLDALHGPNRYGQSVIIDAAEYNSLKLGEIAQRILDITNQDIKHKGYQFKLFNMNTTSDNSAYLEQRKSLTYYALTRLGIPSLAIEVSKDLVGSYWEYWKIVHQLKATKAALHEFGVEILEPVINKELFETYPKEDLKIVINDQVVDLKKTTIKVAQNEMLKVKVQHQGEQSFFAPLTSVFASDRPHFNLLTAARMPIRSFDNIDVRADGVLLTKTKISWTPSSSKVVKNAKNGDLIIWLNDKLTTVAPDKPLVAYQGDRLILEGVKGGSHLEKLNLKGYISSVSKNTGQDIGTEIILNPKSFIPKFLTKTSTPNEYLLEVVRETPGYEKTGYQIHLLPQNISAVVLTTADGNSLSLPWNPEKPIQVAPGHYIFQDIVSDGVSKSVQAFLGKKPLVSGDKFEITDNVDLVLRQATTFSEIGKMTVTVN